MQLTFNNQKKSFTAKDIDQIATLITYKCRVKTYQRVVSMLKYGTGTIPNYGILERLIKEGDNWAYCAGQSYPDEIRTIRNIITNGK